ncbi:MAG: hypothetical protein CBB97_25995 [Candidatus Endolissoclinum sp. TMED37]|nr:MAG: hypothetical protein CBB97_25995 [Candidatus Endolissoclinum sp. TMED37]|tara:strand:+ start:727 stop:2355 length:1629 start_codon:yes stop_codon:yes gene_type:complete
MDATYKVKLINLKKKWRFYRKNRRNIYIIGFFYKKSDLDLVKILSTLKPENIKLFLNEIDGNFAIILEGKSFFLASVDRICSYPLIYANIEDTIYVSDNGFNLKEQLNLKVEDIDTKVSKVFAMSGFTIGNKTIYKKVFNLCAGEFIWITSKKITLNNYYNWKPWIASKSGNNIDRLKNINELIIKKLIYSCNGRQIVLPLSSGWDSRFIASGLRHFGYKNVLCLSYGRKRNIEIKIAKKVAKKLGYNWIQIEYTPSKVKNNYHTLDYREYENYCDNLNAIHFIGEYSMLKELKEKNIIKKDAIFVNGQSGDFITGNHIPEGIDSSTSSEKIIINKYIFKHNKYWKKLMIKDQFKITNTLLKNQINKLLSNKIRKQRVNMHGLYEALEFHNRQVKYVINGVRNYEYFGFEWRMPLWDYEYLKFWQAAHYNNKKKQKLYKTSILEANWGEVWNDIPINPQSSIPTIMKIIRFIFKIQFNFIGRSKWHNFERKYLEYFFDDLEAYRPWPYRKIFFDKRIHFSSISWYIEDYLKRKKLLWNGKKI